ncbi:MAG: cellulase family glycosylhydrolase [Ruminiclostridium sp.]
MNNTKVKSPLQFKKIISLLMTFFILISCINGITFTSSAASSGFYVSGTTICDANGNAFKMRGVNISHAWFSSYTETSIKAAASLGANTVRVVLSDGQIYSKTSYSEVENIINLCKQNNLVCILEVHDTTGSDSTSYLDNAVNYWIEMKSLLNSNTKYVILNIGNEWYGTWNGSAWAEGYKSAIKSLRNAGINNMLMVDCAGWGQYPDSIKNNGKEVFNADSQGNTVFSIHMYEYAGGDSSIVKSNIDNALSIGVPVVIGEFGGQHTNGDVDEYTIMSYCEQKGVGYLGWSWKGNSSGLEYLDISNTWDGSSLTDWGNTLFYNTNGIKNTSSVCSVYGGSGSNSGSSSDNSSNQSSQSDYISLFYGSSSASNWGQAVSVGTTKAGGSFDASNIKAGGHFYVEYKGTDGKVELILQSYSGGASWAKVQPSETGTANGNYYAKYSYDNCAAAFGSNFTSYLDMIHIGAMDAYIEAISLCYDFGTGSGNSSNDSYTDSNGASIGLDGTYYIKSVFSGKYLDVAAGSSSNGANIQQYQFNGSNAQKFKLVGDGNGYYTILTACSDYSSAVDVSGKSKSNGANIIQWKKNGGDNQKFQIVKIGDVYAIKTKITSCGSCLDVYNWSTANGGNIAQYEYWGGDCQLWYLEAC